MKDKKEDVLDPWNSPGSEDDWSSALDKIQDGENDFNSNLADLKQQYQSKEWWE